VVRKNRNVISRKRKEGRKEGREGGKEGGRAHIPGRGGGWRGVDGLSSLSGQTQKQKQRREGGREGGLTYLGQTEDGEELSGRHHCLVRHRSRSEPASVALRAAVAPAAGLVLFLRERGRKGGREGGRRGEYVAETEVQARRRGGREGGREGGLTERRVTYSFTMKVESSGGTKGSH
jgi:hypothetical protein